MACTSIARRRLLLGAAAASLFGKASAQWFPSPILTRIGVPVFGLLCTIAASRYLLARHPDEPWLGWMFVLAVVVKEFASHMRYSTLINDYGQVGDASV